MSSIAGLASVDPAAISAATLAGAGKLTPHDAALPILLAFSTNTITKAFLSVYAGGLRFALCVVPSLALVMLATWTAWWLLLPS